MAVTPNGTPYVVSTDLVANYPTVSLDLAEHIDDELALKLDIAGGKILQMVSTAKTDTASLSTASTTFTSNITGLEATITPSSATSKILIYAVVSGARTTDSAFIAFRIMRGVTAVGVPATAGSRVLLSANGAGNGAVTSQLISTPAVFLDSPATTSATTYGIQAYNSSVSTQTIYINRSTADTDNAQHRRTISTITVMEVSA